MRSPAPRRPRPGAGDLLVGAGVLLVLGAGLGAAVVQPTTPGTSPPSVAGPGPADSEDGGDGEDGEDDCPPQPEPAPAQDAERTTAPVEEQDRTADFDATRSGSFTNGFEDWDLCGPSAFPEPGASVVREEDGYDGTPAARATVPEGDDNKYARTLWGNSNDEAGALDLGEGDDFTYGMALYLPEGFYDDMQSYFVPMRWDNFGTDQVSRGGLAMYADRSVQLFRERDDVEEQVNLLGDTTVELTEGAWHWLEVRQQLSTQDGEARNELFVDGRLVGSSSTANYYGEPVTALRFGIVAIAAGEQTRPLTVLYDRAVLGRGYLGPRP